MDSLHNHPPSNHMAALTDTVHEIKRFILPSTSDSDIKESTLLTLEERVTCIALKDLSLHHSSELDSLGTHLWNYCEQFGSIGTNSQQKRSIVGRARMIAFSLIENGTSKTSLGHTRLLRLSFATARSLIENGQLDLAPVAFTIAAQRLDALQALSPDTELVNTRSLTAEYYMLRAKLACLQDRSDIAEYLYSQVPGSAAINNYSVVAHVCHEIGCNASAANQHGIAMRWLKRAVDRMEEGRHICTSGQVKKYGKMDLCFRHKLAQACLSLNTQDSRQELIKQLDILKKEHGDNVAVLFLCLEGMRISETPDDSQFIETLKRLLSTVNLTRPIMELAHYYIGYSEKFGTTVTLQAFDILFLHLPINQRAWIDQSFILFISIVIGLEIDEEPKISVIDKAARGLDERGLDALSEQGAHAVLALVWKHIDSESVSKRNATMLQWCQLLLNTKILGNCSEFNKIQIQKKFVRCARDDLDLESTRRMLEFMPLRSDFDSYTSEIDLQGLLLMYECELLECGDEPPDCICHQIIRKNPPHNDPRRFNFLQLCTVIARDLEAYTEMKYCLQEISEENQRRLANSKTPETERYEKEETLFALHVLKFVAEKSLHCLDIVEEDILQPLIRQIKLAGDQIPRWESNSDVEFPDSELKWICQTCYSIAWIMLEMSELESAGELIDVLKKIWRPAGGDSVIKLNNPIFLLDLTRHACYARSSDIDEDERTLHYRRIQDMINEVQVLKLDGEFEPMFNGGYIYTDSTSALMKLSLEAAIFLQDWPRVESVFHISVHWEHDFTPQQIMGYLLFMEIPSIVKVFMIRRVLIICGWYLTGSSDSPDREAFPYLLHVLFEACIAAGPANEKVPHDKTVLHPWHLYTHTGIAELKKRFTGDNDGSTYLEIAELALDQAIALAADQNYITGPQHRETHYDANIDGIGGPFYSPCERYPYPVKELEYLATVSFNRAMDFYSEERDVDCKRWAEKSIRLAKLMRNVEGDGLAALFKEKLDGLF